MIKCPMCGHKTVGYVNIGEALRDLTNVYYHQDHLKKEAWDRRGRIITFRFNSYPNVERQRVVIRRFIEGITLLLSSHYTMDVYPDLEFSETNECWIGISQTPVVEAPDNNKFLYGWVSHKYWTQDQIDKFISLVVAITKDRAEQHHISEPFCIPT